MFNVVYQGVDSLYVAFQGALDAHVLEELVEAKQQAENNQSIVPVILGPDQKLMHLQPNGSVGGYAFVLIDPLTGSRVEIKNNGRSSEWNLFLKVRSSHLLTCGYQACKNWTFEILSEIGARYSAHSVNRIDYAVDIHAPNFEPSADSIIAPARSVIKTHWSDQTSTSRGVSLEVVTSGRAVETITIGKSPNRQVQIYNKTVQVRKKAQTYWFDAWKLNIEDPTTKVWRVEIRFGRDFLHDRLKMGRTFDDVDAVLKHELKQTVEKIRYIKHDSNEKNVSRIPNHAFWEIISTTIDNNLHSNEQPITPYYIIEFRRRQRVAMIRTQGVGCLLSALALDKKLSNQDEPDFESLLHDQTATYLREHTAQELNSKANRARERALPFLINE